MIESKILYRGDFTKKIKGIKFVKVQHKFRPEFESRVEELWDQEVSTAKSKGVHIWNGEFYRLTNIDDIQQEDPFILKLSTIPFSKLRAFKNFAKENTLKPEEYPNSISTLGIIQTSDNLYVIGKLGKTIHESSVSFIGGGLQKDELKVNKIEDFELNLRKEMKEEANISDEDIKEIYPIGIVYSHSANSIFCYKVELSIDSESLMEIFKNREEFEMEDLIFLKKNNLLEYIRGLDNYRPLISELI